LQNGEFLDDTASFHHLHLMTQFDDRLKQVKQLPKMPKMKVKKSEGFNKVK
jgi:hypothetical protein